jgi:hypothetical protein
MGTGGIENRNFHGWSNIWLGSRKRVSHLYWQEGNKKKKHWEKVGTVVILTSNHNLCLSLSSGTRKAQSLVLGSPWSSCGKCLRQWVISVADHCQNTATSKGLGVQEKKLLIWRRRRLSRFQLTSLTQKQAHNQTSGLDFHFATSKAMSIWTIHHLMV